MTGVRRTGILGGSFDPIHLGHISIALAAAEECGLGRVLMIPAYVSPFKQDEPPEGAEDRLRMTELACFRHPILKVSDLEIRRGKVSYTIDTLKELEERNPEDEFWFITGTDSFVTLDSWHRGEELLSRYRFILAARPNQNLDAAEKQAEIYRKKYGARIFILHNHMLDISSTQVRAAAVEGKDLTGLVPPEVERYIYEHRLYKRVSETASV